MLYMINQKAECSAYTHNYMLYTINQKSVQHTHLYIEVLKKVNPVLLLKPLVNFLRDVQILWFECAILHPDATRIRMIMGSCFVVNGTPHVNC